MKLPGTLFLLLYCFYSPIWASEKSAEASSHDIVASDPSAPLVMLPVTTVLADPSSKRIFLSFLAELTLEIVSLGVVSAAMAAKLACNLPALLTAALSLTILLYAAKIGLIIPRAKIIRDFASTAGSPGCRTPALQAMASAMSVAIDFSRACALLFTAIQSHYCEVGAHTTATPLSATLFIILLLGLIQLNIALPNMIIWSRDTKELLSAAALQE